MSLPVIIIRPQPGADQSQTHFAAEQIDARAFPLFAIEAVPCTLPDKAQYDALVLASANAVRHTPDIASFRSLPVYAVGAKSAMAARDNGLNVVHVGQGGITSLLRPLATAGYRHVLRLSAADHIEIDSDMLARHAAEALQIDTQIVYRSTALPMPDRLIRTLKQPAIILLHSARSAGHFAEQCAVHGINRSHLTLATFGPAIAQAAGSGWLKVETAVTPDDEALLELVRQLCK